MTDDGEVAALRQRIANLETLDGLLNMLTGVLDIREVFDRVSAIADKVLPHDALSIAESIDGAGESGFTRATDWEGCHSRSTIRCRIRRWSPSPGSTG